MTLIDLEVISAVSL